MDIDLVITWLNSVQDAYGYTAHEAMNAHAVSHPHSAGTIAMHTYSFGLHSEDAEFLTLLAEKGADINYLNYLTESFIKIRGDHFGL